MNNFRIVIDTNIIVSALIFAGSSSMKAFTLSKQQGTILISNDIFLELTTVLSRKKFDRYITQEIRENFLAGLILETEMINIREKINDCRDPKDNKFLEAAVNGNADYLLTGDQDLLILHPFRHIKIITINQFLSYF